MVQRNNNQNRNTRNRDNRLTQKEMQASRREKVISL